MVGFGSSLRLARRPGWEGAYLDYEALKLLLSHIEAIYEEGTHNHHHYHHPGSNPDSSANHHHHQQHAALGRSWDAEDDVYTMSHHDHNQRSPHHLRGLPSSRKQRRDQRRARRRMKYDDSIDPNDTTAADPNVLRDYKVDLFLESDSDQAYISVDYGWDDDEEDATTDDEDDDESINQNIHDYHLPDGRMEETSHIKPFAGPHPRPVDDRSFDGGGDPYDHYDSEDNLMIIQPKNSSGNSCWGGGNSQTSNSTTVKMATTSATSGSTVKRKSKTTRSHHHLRSHRKGAGSGGSSQLLHPSGSGGPPSTDEDPRTRRPHQYYDMAASSSSSQHYQPPTTPPWQATYPYYGDSTSETTSYHYQDALHYFIRPGATALSNSTANESTALLQPPLFNTPSNDKNGSISPPHRTFFSNRSVSTEPNTTSSNPLGAQPHAHVAFGVNSAIKMGSSAAVGASEMTIQKKPKFTAQEIRRRQERRRRRREQKQRLRQHLEKKVPRHIRIAHTKARAITERFLGLLRAETEKVLLFAQSRLGELADTAGSLRFPSYDEEYASNHPSLLQPGGKNNNDLHAGGHDYEFGDGGMHPSASSSSDDQYNGGANYGRQQQQQRFSDSSDDENDDQSNHLSTAINLLSHSNSNNNTSGTGKVDATINSTKMTTTATTTRSKEADHLRYIQRQIANFTELRKRRAIFQRNEQILGEDMLFLSAVEEVDGYTAVGVELLHTLKYICINLIAVRKICRKHDRLLMNRMLGGYYHRLRKHKSNIAGVQTLGGMVTQISGDIYEAHPSVLGQRSHFKLVGVYDHKIQNLANSRTVQVVSSCLALSLSEYEVARSRADALTRLNSVTSMDSGSLRHGNNNAGSDNTDVESMHDDVPSTASNISLTRLRYTIMSIFALREVSRTKRDYVMTYLSRVSLAFTGQPVIGEGLDGCSRETLDFLVSYNPDTALLSDATLLYEGLKQNRWSCVPLGDVMIASLATATIQSDLTAEVKVNMLHREESNVAYAVSANPDSNIDFWKALLNGQSNKISALSNRTVVIRQLPPIVLRISRTSLLLYSVRFVNWNTTLIRFVGCTDNFHNLFSLIISFRTLLRLLM